MRVLPRIGCLSSGQGLEQRRAVHSVGLGEVEETPHLQELAAMAREAATQDNGNALDHEYDYVHEPAHEFIDGAGELGMNPAGGQSASADVALGGRMSASADVALGNGEVAICDVTGEGDPSGE